MLDLKNAKQDSLSEYTPFPFWFWNDTLTKSEISRQISDFHQKGVDGFIIHPRIGLPKAIKYLGSDYLDFVEFAVQSAQRLKMKVILYDEAMYPSGSAHGEVVKNNPHFASRGLGFVDEKYYLEHCMEEGFEELGKYFKKESAYFEWVKQAESSEQEIFYLISEYSGGTIRGIHEGEDDGQPNAPQSSDLLNPAVTALFIEKTHEIYYQRLSRFFGETIVGFFTDEPEIMGRKHKKGLQAWSNQILDYYIEKHIPVKNLISLFTNTPSKSVDRVQYQKIVHQLLTKNYYQPLSDWCGAHHIFLTGHPAKSDDIGYLRSFQVPGQDLVWRWVAPENNLESRHSMIGKCSADSARHSGARRNSNEVFGCCGPEGEQWALSPADLKWYLDWLFVRGVNLIVPHAFFYSLRTPLQEDRLPDVGPHNIWWNHFNYYSNYIKYMSWLMTESTNHAEIAVLTADTQMPYQKMKALYENQIEFNYLETYYLDSNKYQLNSEHLKVSKQEYQLILLENEEKFSQVTQEKLQQIRESGIPVVDISQFTDDELWSAVSKRIEKPFVSENRAVRFSQLEKEHNHFSLLSNEGEKKECVLLKVPNSSQMFRIFDPWSNQVYRQESDSDAVLKIDLDYRQLLIIEEIIDIETRDVISLQSFPKKEVEFQSKIKTNNRIINHLGDWCDFSGKANFSGSVSYSLQIQLQAFDQDNKYYLNLGNVKDIVVLKINNQIIDTKFWEPYEFEISAYLSHKGEFKCSLEVKNLLANAKNHLRLPSGLMGPIKVLEEGRED